MFYFDQFVVFCFNQFSLLGISGPTAGCTPRFGYWSMLSFTFY